MQVILNIDDDVLRDMQMHADIKEEVLNVMLSNMFIKYVSEPGRVITEEARKDDCREFEDFQMRLYSFLTNTAYNPNNIAIHKVLIKLRELLTEMHIMTDLYNTYKSSI